MKCPQQPFQSLIVVLLALTFFSSAQNLAEGRLAQTDRLENQTIESIQQLPCVKPALVGSDASPIVKIRVVTSGSASPIALTKVVAGFETETLNQASTFQIHYSQHSQFDPKTCEVFFKRSDRQPKESSVFQGRQKLAEGENFFWLSCKLNSVESVDLDGRLSGKIEQLEFSDGRSEFLNAKGAQRIGLAFRQSGDDNVNTFRIPGLVTTNSGSLIAVYDIRWDNSRDLPGNIDVGMSRSTDGGKTWGPMRTIMDMGNDPNFRGEGIGDPCILVDRNTGTIWVSAVWSHGNRGWWGSGPGLTPDQTGQWMMVKSDDDGRTWSEPINNTMQIKNPDWCFLLQGPGKGICMSDGTLVFPAQYQDPPNSEKRNVHRLPHSTIVYSRDHGNTWSIGTGAFDDTTESQVIELEDGRLMLNCRYNRTKMRAVLTSDDLGQTWHTHESHLTQLTEPGACMGSLIHLGRELAWRGLNGSYRNQPILFSNPNSLQAREKITIKASQDMGKSWPDPNQVLLDDGIGRGYSCMTVIDEQTIGILYEGSQSDLTFQRIKLADLNLTKD